MGCYALRHNLPEKLKSIFVGIFVNLGTLWFRCLGRWARLKLACCSRNNRKDGGAHKMAQASEWATFTSREFNSEKKKRKIGVPSSLPRKHTLLNLTWNNWVF